MTAITPEVWPESITNMVHVIGPNPAIDRLQVVHELRPGAVHRVRSVTVRAGGKAFIVARSIRRLGVGVNIYGLLGGAPSAIANEECERLDIGNRHTVIQESTRITPVIVEEITGRSTVLNEPGPKISEHEETAFRQRVFDAIQPGAVLVCTGSLPPDIDTRLYSEISAIARERGAFVAIDASGDALAQTLDASPWLVKCNLSEFLHATGEDSTVVDQRELATLMRREVHRGCSIIIVTRGASDFLAATADGVWAVKVPSVDVVNATGSGDTFLACFVATAAQGGSFEDALRSATAGGAMNAAQLEPGLQADCDLSVYAAAVGIRELPLDAPVNPSLMA